MTPRLYAWGPRTLFLGPSQNLSPHRNAVACVTIGVENEFRVAEDPKNATASYRACRSVLVYPNTLHHFRDAQGLMAFLYLDPLSRDLDRVGTLMKQRDERAAFDLTNEEQLIAAILALWQTDLAWREAREVLGRLLLGITREPDPRIKLAIQQIALDPDFSSSAHFSAAFREMFGMPPSRLARAGLQLK